MSSFLLKIVKFKLLFVYHSIFCYQESSKYLWMMSTIYNKFIMQQKMLRILNSTFSKHSYSEKGRTRMWNFIHKLHNQWIDWATFFGKCESKDLGQLHKLHILLVSIFFVAKYLFLAHYFFPAFYVLSYLLCNPFK